MNLPISPTAGLRPHPSNWTKEPEKANTHCLYCRQPVPNHAPDCIVPGRFETGSEFTELLIKLDDLANERADAGNAIEDPLTGVN